MESFGSRISSGILVPYLIHMDQAAQMEFRTFCEVLDLHPGGVCIRDLRVFIFSLLHRSGRP